MEFLTLLEQARFSSVELVGETGFNSSPVTKGVLVRAVKVVSGCYGEAQDQGR
jgi:hypothetical protein